MKAKRVMALGLAAAMTVGMMGTISVAKADDAATGSVYYLNFKPEADEAWQALAKAYTEETGVEVKVVTAASNQYETTLTSEMGKSGAPTLFQVNGPVGLANWKDYCMDLTGSAITEKITSDAFLLKDGDAIDAVAFAVETYGLIVNKTLLEKAGYSVEDINSFDSLKEIADDLQARKDELGIKGAFSSAGMDGSSNWRFQTHLANLPIYYEYQDAGIYDTEAIEGTYLDNYKNILDLYFTDSTCDPAELSAKTGNDSLNEFLAGEAVFYQNGSWAYADLTDTFTDDEIQMIPIYFGVDDENQGLCSGTENYWCVSSEASEEDQQATLDFIDWCVSSETGTKAMAEDMGFNIPFTTAQEPTNVFFKQEAEVNASGKTPVDWSFSTIPSQTWKDDLASDLTLYAAGQEDWEEVVATFVDEWAEEKEAAAE